MLTCDWCKAPGQVIGKSWGSLVIVKCTKCHHEWEAVKPKPDDKDFLNKVLDNLRKEDKNG